MRYVPKVHILFRPALKTNLPVGEGTFPVTFALREAFSRAIPSLSEDVRILSKGKELNQAKSLEYLGIQNDDVLIFTF